MHTAAASDWVMRAEEFGRAATDPDPAAQFRMRRLRFWGSAARGVNSGLTFADGSGEDRVKLRDSLAFLHSPTAVELELYQGKTGFRISAVMGLTEGQFWTDWLRLRCCGSRLTR